MQNLREQVLAGPVTTARGLKLEKRGEQYVMSGGRWGEHSVYAPATSEARLKAHWDGYKQTHEKSLA